MSLNAQPSKLPVRGHVLVVDDEPPIVQALQALLEDEEYEVSVAFNGQEALDALQAGLRPDVIILDLMMPVLDGWGFWQASRPLRGVAQIPVVVVSADRTVPARAAEVGVRAYLAKPFDVDDLLATIERVIEDRRISGNGWSGRYPSTYYA